MTKTETALKLVEQIGGVRPKDQAGHGIAPVYLRRRKCPLDEILRCAKVCRVQSVIQPYLEVLANLADMSGKITVNVHAESKHGFDKSKLQNGVLEPLKEADLIQ